MTQRAPGRKSALIALTAVALLALGALAPAASAQVSTSQIPGTDAVGTVTDSVGTVTGGGGDSDGSTSGGGGGGSDPVGGTVDPVAGGTGGTVGGTVDTVTDTTSGTTDKATGGVGTVVDSTSGTVKDTTDQTKKTIENTTNETGTAVNTAVNGAGDTVRDAGGTVTNPLMNVKDPQGRDPKGDGKVTARESNLGPGAGNTRSKYGGELAAERASHKIADRTKAGSLAAPDKKSRTNISAVPASASAPLREGFITQLAQAATEAAEKLAFPLGLALMVGAFLMLQGRIDRKDAKLVLAPIDSEQDLLSFQ